MRTMVNIRHNPAVLYARLKRGLVLGICATALLGSGFAVRRSTHALLSRPPAREGTTSAGERSQMAGVETSEVQTLISIDPRKTGAQPSASPGLDGASPRGRAGEPAPLIGPRSRSNEGSNPHSFLPYSAEARPGLVTHPRRQDHPLSSAPSRLHRLFSSPALGPGRPLALAIPQAERLFPYPVSRREFLVRASNASGPEVRPRASACLAQAGTPDCLTIRRTPRPGESPAVEAAPRLDGVRYQADSRATATKFDRCAYRLGESAEDLLFWDDPPPFFG